MQDFWKTRFLSTAAALLGIHFLILSALTIGVSSVYGIGLWTKALGLIVFISVVVAVFYLRNYIQLKLTNHWIEAFLLFLLAFLLRILWVELSGVVQSSDFSENVELARGVLNGAEIIHPTRHAGPIVLNALFSYFFGENLTPHLMFNALLGSLEVLVTYLFCLHWFRAKVAFLAALLLAIYPPSIYYCGLVGTEVPFSLLFIGAFYLFLCSKKNGFIWFMLGVTVGLSIYFRPYAYIFAAIMFGSHLISEISVSRAVGPLLKPLAIMSIGLVLTVSPVVVKNYSAYGIVSPNPTHFTWWTILIGANQISEGQYSNEDRIQVESLLESRYAESSQRSDKRSVFVRDEIAKELAIKRIFSDIPAYLRLIITSKHVNTWARVPNDMWSLHQTIFGSWEHRRIVNQVSLPFHGFNLLFCGVAFFAFARRPRQRKLFGTVGAVFIAVVSFHLITESQSRYHFYLIPFMGIFGAYGFVTSLDLLKRSRFLPGLRRKEKGVN